MENWKVIDGFEKYEISNQGFVRNKKTGGMLKTQYTNGYKCIYIRNDELKKKFKVHRLVALHFIPTVEGRLHINHIDGNKENNTQSNLEWVSPKENSEHVVANKLQGTRSRISKETKGKALDEYKNTNISQIKLAEKYGVTIRSIERWVSADKKNEEKLS